MCSFYGWVTSHCIQHCIFFIHSSDDGPLGCFHHLNIMTENSLYIFFSEHSTWCLVPANFLALNIIFQKKQVAQKQWENDYHNLSPRASISWVPLLSVTTHCSGRRRKGIHPSLGLSPLTCSPGEVGPSTPLPATGSWGLTHEPRASCGWHSRGANWPLWSQSLRPTSVFWKFTIYVLFRALHARLVPANIPSSKQ